MNILDTKAESVHQRLWLVNNSDGTREIVLEREKAGRGGFSPPYGQPYREVLADFVKSLELDAKAWVEFALAYTRGVAPAKGPLGGRPIPAISFVADNHTYTAYVGTHHKGGFLGFGGALATITMADGTVHESNNVWSGRDVPPSLRKTLPNNATIKWSR